MDSIFTDFDTSFGNGYYSGMDGVDGGNDIFHNGGVFHHHAGMPYYMQNGHQVIEQDNIWGGHDTIVDGHLVQSTHDNVLGGEDVYRDGHLHQVTAANEHGGVDIYNGDMQHEGMTFANAFGSEDYFSIHGNVDTMLDYQDPLMHSAEYRINPFKLK